MGFKPEEIASIIQEEIKQYGKDLDVSEVGQVIEVGDGIARIYGLRNAMAGEMLTFENGVAGQVFNLEEDSIGAIILGDSKGIKEGFSVECTGKVLSVPCGPGIIGRVVDPLGNPLDGKPAIKTDVYRPVESPAPGIADRQSVFEPLQTGIKAIDSMIPIGRGQRELIIGDRKTGKTAIAIDAIINQKDTGVICVYVAIGQKDSTVAAVVETLKQHGALDYTVVVNASSSAPAPQQFIAPYSGCAIAEYFMYEENKHTLVIYDDLSKQAVAYRQVSLLLNRPPGREAFPGDVFYLHSRLLERAAKLSDDLGAGSLTALPIIETQEGEVSAYIPTNVISITDGQIYLVPDLFFNGVRPAVDVGISVSRVGGSAQVKAMKKIAGSLRLDLAAFRELEAFAQMGTDLDPASAKQLERGKRMVEILKQGQYKPLNIADQVIIIYAGTQGYLDDIAVKDVAKFEQDLLEYMHSSEKGVVDALKEKTDLSEEDKLKSAIKKFKSKWKSQVIMAEIKTLVKRRKSAKNIQKITKTMALIAAAKYKVASRKVTAAKPYAESLNKLVADLMSRDSSLSHPLASKREKVQNVALIVIASNRGFCGSYNANIVNYAKKEMKSLEEQGKNVSLHVVGKKATPIYNASSGEKQLYLDLEDAKYDKVYSLAELFVDQYLNHKVDEVRVVFMEYISATQQTPKATTFLPFPIDEYRGEESSGNYEVYPDVNEVLNYVVPQSIYSNLYRIFLEGSVSEHISRMIAMNKATDNAADMIKDLTRLYNRARQAKITSELSEIMGAVRSLQK